MRYLPLTPDDRSAMLAAIGAKSIDDLFVDVPKAAHRDGFVDLPRVAGEMEVGIGMQIVLECRPQNPLSRPTIGPANGW